VNKIEIKTGSQKLIAATAFLTVIGFSLWVYQIVRGLFVSDMRNLSPWGLYITMFMFFVGLSAGGLIIATVPRVFGLKGFKPVSKIAVYLAICCTVLAGLFIVVDLGRPERMWHLLAYSNLGSPLMWDVLVIPTYLIVSTVYLWATLRAEKGKGSEASLKMLSTVALITAILVHSVTAWIFGLQIGRPFWHTSLLAPMFISSALVSGLALTLFVVLILQKVGYLQRDPESKCRMASLLGLFVLVDLFLLFCELITAAYPLGGTEFQVVKTMLTGIFAPMFWIEVLGGLLAAFLLLNTGTQKDNRLVGGASLLAILGIFFKRYQLLLGGFQFPNLTHFSITTGPVAPDAGTWWRGLQGSFIYFPSIFEWSLTIGVVSMGALLLTLGLKYLPLKPAK